MITRPSEYKHNNNSMAFVDEENVRGGRRVVNDLNELYALSSIILDKLKDNITIVRVNSEDKDYRLIDKTLAGTSAGWVVNSVVSTPEVSVSKLAPTSPDFKLWIKLPLNDIDVLKSIRDANPNSVLPSLWPDSKDPSIWPGITIVNGNVTVFGGRELSNGGISNVVGINKLTHLTKVESSGNLISDIDLSNLTELKEVLLGNNMLTNINITGSNAITILFLNDNDLTSIPSLTALRSISMYSFVRNELPIAELNRFRGLGFISEYNIFTQRKTNLEILRQIRDANPSSLLTNKWLDSANPYTWQGVTWEDNTNTKVLELDVNNSQIHTLPNINQLRGLKKLICYANSLEYIEVSAMNNLTTFNCALNRIISIPLDRRGKITTADFFMNKMMSNEVDRLKLAGFTSSEIGLQNPNM